MKSAGRKICIVAVLAGAVLTAWSGRGAQANKPEAGANDWVSYRGPNGDGISDEKGWNTDWKTPPAQLWKAEVGKGYSSVSVVGGKVYTLGNTGAQDVLWCFDAKKGTVIWKKELACRSGGGNPGPRATPTVDGGRVYTVHRDGQIVCWDADKGDIKWQKKGGEFGGQAGTWAFSGSALIADKAVIVDVGTVVALDKVTGNVIWQSEAWKAGYATPVLFEIKGKKHLAIFSADTLRALDLEKGAEVWKFPWKTAYDVNAANPIPVDENLFITTGYGTGCALVAAEKGTEVYRNKSIASHFTTPILYKGLIYGITGNTNQAGKSKDAAVVCLDPADGKVKWSQKGDGPNSLMLADGKLIIQLDSGELVVAEAIPDGWKQLARAPALPGGVCWTMPVLSGGVIYCRNDAGVLVALDVGGK